MHRLVSETNTHSRPRRFMQMEPTIVHNKTIFVYCTLARKVGQRLNFLTQMYVQRYVFMHTECISWRLHPLYADKLCRINNASMCTRRRACREYDTPRSYSCLHKAVIMPPLGKYIHTNYVSVRAPGRLAQHKSPRNGLHLRAFMYVECWGGLYLSK
jgi:hypothetical protein